MNQHDEIKRFLSRWTAAEASGDTTALEAWLADDFTGIGPLGFSLSKKDWLERHATGALKYKTFALEDVQLRVYGDAVVATARQTSEATYQGHPVRELGIDHVVMITGRLDGQDVARSAAAIERDVSCLTR